MGLNLGAIITLNCSNYALTNYSHYHILQYVQNKR